MKTTTTCAVVAALGLAAVLTAPTVQAADPVSHERILTSGLLVAHGGAKVTTLDPDGTARAPVKLPDDLEDFNKSTWSHDGTRVLHSNVLVFDDSGELVAFRPAITAPDGSGYRLLRMRTQPMDLYCSAWSLDDTRILCGTRRGVFSFRVRDGRGGRRVTTNPYGGQDLAVGYSPDGTTLAWLRERPDPTPDQGTDLEREALYVADADGAHARRVTAWGLLQAHEVAGATWSPDGTTVISANRHGRLVEIEVATGTVTPVPLDLRRSDYAVMPDYSPDGQQVVFSMFRKAPADLFVANLDGSGLQQITHTADRSELSPDWATVP
jgi:Tol biopolymer transport system component